MTLYSINTAGKEFLQYTVFGIACAGIGLYLGACSSCANKKPSDDNYKSNHSVQTSNMQKEKKSRPLSRLEIFEQYAWINQPDSRNLEERMLK